MAVHPKGLDTADLILPGCGRYEFSDGKSNKFWRVRPMKNNEPYGDYEITWGRIGTSGQSQEVPRETAAKRIREKVTKGYQLIAPLENPFVKKDPFTVKKGNPVPKSDFLEELLKIK